MANVIGTAGEAWTAVYVIPFNGIVKLISGSPKAIGCVGPSVPTDGENWFDTFISITGTGLLPVDLPPALSARIKVFSVEKTESQVYVHVMS